MVGMEKCLLMGKKFILMKIQWKETNHQISVGHQKANKPIWWATLPKGFRKKGKGENVKLIRDGENCYKVKK